MESINPGTVATIAIVVFVVVSIIYFMSKGRSQPDAGARSASEAKVDSAAAVMSAVTPRSNSETAFRDHLKDHTPEQIADVPVYALAHLITASLSSPSRVRWLESVVATIVPRGVDPELVHTAEFFWDLNERWLFGTTCADDFCGEYLIAGKDEWSAEVRERIVLAGLAALASSDFNGTYSGADHDRVVADLRTALERVSVAYFGEAARESVAALDRQARELAPQISAKAA